MDEPGRRSAAMSIEGGTAIQWRTNGAIALRHY
jgi:hypothetical protein